MKMNLVIIYNLIFRACITFEGWNTVHKRLGTVSVRIIMYTSLTSIGLCPKHIYYYYYYCCHHHHHHHHCHHLYAGYLQLYTWNKPCCEFMQCCSRSVFTVCATCNIISPVKYVLSFYISTCRGKSAVPNMALFCISLISCFPGMLLRYCLSDFEIVPIAPIFTDITFALTFHKRWISITSSLYFKIFSASFLITLLSPGIATSVSMHVPFLLSRIMMSGLLLGIVLSVCTCWSHNMVALILYYYYYYYYYYYLRKYVATEVGNTWIITLAPGSSVVVVIMLIAGRLVMIPNWGTGLHVPANVGYDYGPPSLLFIGYRG